MSMMGGGFNGQWVRARNTQSAKAFVAEREFEEQQRREVVSRIGRFFGRLGRGIGQLFRRRTRE